MLLKVITVNNRQYVNNDGHDLLMLIVDTSSATNITVKGID